MRHDRAKLSERRIRSLFDKYQGAIGCGLAAIAPAGISAWTLRRLFLKHYPKEYAAVARTRQGTGSVIRGNTRAEKIDVIFRAWQRGGCLDIASFARSQGYSRQYASFMLRQHPEFLPAARLAVEEVPPAWLLALWIVLKEHPRHFSEALEASGRHTRRHTLALMHQWWPDEIKAALEGEALGRKEADYEKLTEDGRLRAAFDYYRDNKDRVSLKDVAPMIGETWASSVHRKFLRAFGEEFLAVSTGRQVTRKRQASASPRVRAWAAERMREKEAENDH